MYFGIDDLKRIFLKAGLTKPGSHEFRHILSYLISIFTWSSRMCFQASVFKLTAQLSVKTRRLLDVEYFQNDLQHLKIIPAGWQTSPHLSSNRVQLQVHRPWYGTSPRWLRGAFLHTHTSLHKTRRIMSNFCLCSGSLGSYCAFFSCVQSSL